MSLAKSFSSEQIAVVQSWADQGEGLSGIQKRLAEEMEIKVTYLELRFLLDDLGVQMPDEEVAPQEQSDLDEEVEEKKEDRKDPKGNNVAVSISKLQRPGAVISGTAQFAGGEQAEWWLDQLGQLGMSPKNKDFRPNDKQMRAFQKELQKAVQSEGGY